MRRVLEGTIMKDREFDDDEIDYLRSLPAVNSVGRNRIRYTGQFREYCMRGIVRGTRRRVYSATSGLTVAYRIPSASNGASRAGR